MDLSELRDETMQTIGMSEAPEETLVDRWLNQGVTQVILRSGCAFEEADVVLDAGVTDYEIDADILRIHNSFSLTGNRELTRLSVFNLTNRRARNATSGSVFYYAGKGNTMLFHPPPAEETEITVFFVPRPPPLVEDVDIPAAVPEEWHYLICSWALYRAAVWDERRDADRFRQEFSDGIKEMRKYTTFKTGSRLAPVRLAFRRRLNIHSDPSYDY